VFKGGGPRILGVRAQRDPGGDRGHLLQRGRKTRRRRETRLTRWDRGVSDGARVRCGPSGVSGGVRWWERVHAVWGQCGERGKGWAALGRAGRKEGGDGLGRAGAWAGPVWAEGLVSGLGLVSSFPFLF